MKELISLVKINLKIKRNVIFGEEKQKIIKKILNILFIVAALTGATEILLMKVFNILYLSNNEILIFNFIINFELIMMTIITFITIINRLFLASGWNELFIYPIRTGNLVLSKCILCYFDNIIISILVLIPLFSYGFLNNESLHYYIHIILYQIIISIIPIIYSTLILLTILWIETLILKSKVNHTNNKWLIIVDIIIALLTYMLLKSSLNNHINVINLLFNIFFYGNDIPVVFSINKEIMINFMIIITIIISSLIGLYFIGENEYLAIMKSGVLNSKDSKKVEQYTSQYKFKKRSIIVSNIIRDVKLIIRTPALKMSCFSVNIVFAVWFLIFIISARNKLMIIQNNFTGIKSIIICVYTFATTLSNVTLVTSFSREGRYLNQLKSFPIDGKQILLSKVFVGVLSCIASLVAVDVLIIFISVDFYEFILLQIVEIIQILAIIVIHIQIDLNSMNLKWIDIKELGSGHAIQIMTPFFIVTSLLIAYGIFIKIVLNIEITEWPSIIFSILVNGIYSLYSLKKMIINVK